MGSWNWENQENLEHGMNINVKKFIYPAHVAEALDIHFENFLPDWITHQNKGGKDAYKKAIADT